MHNPLTLGSCLQLLDTNAVGVRREKMYKLDGHVACAVAGITGEPALLTLSMHGRTGNIHKPYMCAADANILINTCRLAAQRYTFAYQEPIPVEQLVRTLCDNKQVGSLYVNSVGVMICPMRAHVSIVLKRRATHNMGVSDPLAYHYCTQAGKFVPVLLHMSIPYLPTFVAQGQQLSPCMHVFSTICGHVDMAMCMQGCHKWIPTISE